MKLPNIIIFISILYIVPWLDADTVNSCRVCHSDINSKYRKSIHYEREFDCIICHGGNPDDLTFSSMSRANGFKGRIKREEIPSLCASCHSDSEKMLQYGHFFDQYNIYKSSRHGKLLSRGDTKVAVCTDCHGVHNIRRVSDPASSAYWKNVPFTCARCHSDKEYMKQYAIPAGQFEKYKDSVHGRLRLEKGDMRSPGCPDCHGSHGAAPPGVTEVENVCGKCHVLERKNFMMGPHRKALVQKKLKECITCHGAHGTHETGAELFTRGYNENNGMGCLACHKEDTQEYEVGLKILSIFKRIEESIKAAEQMTERARQKGFDIDEELLKIDEARSRLNELKPVTHTLSLQLINEGAENAEVLARDVQEMVHAKMIEWRDRRVTLGINIVLFVTVIVLLYVIRRRMLKNGIQGMDK